MAHHAEISFVKGKHQLSMLKRDNVVGVGVGFKVHRGKQTDELCLLVLVSEKLPLDAVDPKSLVPKSIDGVNTDVIEVGFIRSHQSRTDRWRPIPAGVSIGHYKITAGTFGCMVRDQSSNERLILSNNHVLANSNNAELGDPILQPGTADGGRVDNDIAARLERFAPISFNEEPPTCNIATTVASLINQVAALLGSQHRLIPIRQDPQAINQVDAAVAKPVNGVEISDEILDIGVIGGVTPAKLGMRVRKSGRSTGFTTGMITVMDATVDVNYGNKVARFDSQLISTSMSAPGDSGSLLVAEDSLLAVGLLYAGSDQVTIYNPIQIVLDRLKVLI
jgi:hypothetical protein